MSYEPVDVILRERAPVGPAIPGVNVRLFSQDGTYLYGEAVSNAQGVASFLLPAPVTYQARFYKPKVDFAQPVLLAVPEGVPSRFEVYGTPFVYPQSVDPRLCLASGFFRRPDGSVAPNLDLRFSNKFQPVVLEGDAIFPRTFSTRTDARGYVQVHLLRGALYDVEVEGLEQYSRCVAVPDWPWVNLAHLLLPVVKAVSFDVPGPYSLAVGGTLTLRPTVYSTDLRELAYSSDVLWTVSDTRIAALEYGLETLTLRGLTPGAFELRAQRLDPSIVYVPNLPMDGVPLAVTVA